MDHDCHDERLDRSGWRSKVAFAVMLALAGFFLLMEHRAHLFGFLPYLLFLACPLMHLFHHGSHNHRGAQGDKRGLPPGAVRKES